VDNLAVPQDVACNAVSSYNSVIPFTYTYKQTHVLQFVIEVFH